MTKMETIVAAQTFNESVTQPKILPLTPEDIAKLEKQRRIFDIVIIIMLSAAVCFELYLTWARSYYSLIYAIPSVLFLLWFRYRLLKNIRISLEDGTKYTGTARVTGKGSYSNSYWLWVDWPFEGCKKVNVYFSDYASVNTGDMIYLEVLPKIKAAVKVKK